LKSTIVRFIIQIVKNDGFFGNEQVRPRKGAASRAAILLAAARLATTKGLRALSIGDLASHLGMSKSGLYAHFGSKEELELATIETATRIFDQEVLQPVRDAAAGTRRLRALADAFNSHLERRVFPGGCFFAAVMAELDTQPGRARDRVLEVVDQWRSLIGQCLEEAKDLEEIDRDADVAQATFEVQAMLTAANFMFVTTSDSTPLRRARKGIENVLSRSRVRGRSGEPKVPAGPKRRR
jgi:AcrR family transcriptional regulator